MSSTGFFNYPSGASEAQASDDSFLDGCSEDDWALIRAHSETLHFYPGDVVIAPEEGDRSLYLVVAGRLEIHIMGGLGGRGRQVATVEPGSVLGEVAFFDAGPRSARVTAATEVHLLRLPFDEFEALAQDDPCLARVILTDLGRVLARRLRTMQALLRTADI